MLCYALNKDLLKGSNQVIETWIETSTFGHQYIFYITQYIYKIFSFFYVYIFFCSKPNVFLSDNWLKLFGLRSALIFLQWLMWFSFSDCNRLLYHNSVVILLELFITWCRVQYDKCFTALPTFTGFTR